MQLFRYQRPDGSEPFTEWLNGVADKVTQARIRVRLQRLAAGNPGDAKPIGGGVSELRFQFGAGYRIYLSQQGATWILLLCGGDKSSQQRDIAKAQGYLDDWKARQK